MTDQERQQHLSDLNAVVSQLEFRVHMGNTIITRLRREFWMINLIFLLFGMIIGAAFYDWLCP